MRAQLFDARFQRILELRKGLDVVDQLDERGDAGEVVADRMRSSPKRNEGRREVMVDLQESERLW